MILHIPTGVRVILAETAHTAGVDESVVWQTAVDQFQGLDAATRGRLVSECVATATGPREAVEWTMAAAKHHVAITTLWVFSKLSAADRLELVLWSAWKG